MFSRNILLIKNTESTYMPTFEQKNPDVNTFWSVFKYFFLHLENSDSKKHSCQISAEMSNI